MTNEERVQELHKRMKIRKRQRNNTRRLVSGLCSLALFMGLVVLVGNTGITHQGSTAGLYSGATLLFESVGGYVLVALIAFMAGVVITVMLKKGKDREICQRKTLENKAEYFAGDGPGADALSGDGESLVRSAGENIMYGPGGGEEAPR